MLRLTKWGYDFEDAERVIVIRSIDITRKKFLKEILDLIKIDEHQDLEKFFKEKKICFLATQENYINFLKVLQQIENPENPEKKSL